MNRAIWSGRQYLPAPLLGLALIVGGVGCSTESNTSKESETSSISEEPSSDPAELETLLEVSPARRVRKTPPRFRECSDSLGVHFQRYNDFVPDRYFLPEVMGGGVAWFDFDGDSQLDLYATNGCPLLSNDPPEQSQHLNRLYRNQGGHFTEVTLSSGCGDSGYGQGCAVGDFDADGFPDLFLANFGRNALLANNGDGTFSDVTGATEMGDESWGTSAVWFDANSDGLADLFVVNYLNISQSNHKVCTYGGVEGYCGPGQWEGVPDLLYLNLGDGRFQVVTPSDGADAANAKGLAVAVCDFDSDLVPEIYVANDMAPNFLLTRSGQRDFSPIPLYRNVADAAGCAVSSDGRNEASMGIACADFDSDGLADLFLTHYYQHKNTLYRNLGTLLFEDDSRRSRAAATGFESLGFGTLAIDFDLDMDVDLFVANGHVLGPKQTPNEMLPQLLENDGGGLFQDVSSQVGGYFAQKCLGRGAAKGDFDNDGRIDLAVSHLDQPLAILRNETESANYIGLELLPRNRVCPAGGSVAISTGPTRRVIPIVGGGSYLSTSDLRILIGLGNHRGPVEITLNWPTGRRDTYSHLSSNCYWTLREGETELVSPVSMNQHLMPGYERSN